MKISLLRRALLHSARPIPDCGLARKFVGAKPSLPWRALGATQGTLARKPPKALGRTSARLRGARSLPFRRLPRPLSSPSAMEGQEGKPSPEVAMLSVAPSAMLSISLLIALLFSFADAGIESILKKKKKPRVQNKSEVITVRGLSEGQLPGTGGNSEAVVVRISKDELRQFLAEGGLNAAAVQ